GAGFHGGDDGKSWPELIGGSGDGGHHFGVDGGVGRRGGLIHFGDGDFGIGQHLFEGALDILGLIDRQQAAVDGCGRAFSAWPAESMVATQVVRIWALYRGMAERRARAAASSGFCTIRLRSSPSWPPYKLAPRSKAARVTSKRCTGKSNLARRERPSAR